MFWLYNFLLFLSLPFFPAVKLFSSKRGKVSLRGRFSTDFKGAEGKVLLHVSSIGEVNSVKPLVNALKGNVALTVFTNYGLERAKSVYPEVPSRISPLDLYPLVRLFLRRVRPKAVLLYETEIWPSLLKVSSQFSVPLFFVSGKVSERSFKRLKFLRGFLKPLLEDKFFLAKSSEDAERALKLGFESVNVVGDLKLDYEPPEELAQLEVEGDRLIVIWGSTHEGEEKLAERIHYELKKSFPSLLTVVAPRHVGRKVELSGRVAFRSQTKKVEKWVDFYVVDTVGELSSLYRYAHVAVIGGSFVRGIGGHNPVEPVAFKVPTLIGEYGRDFFDVARQIKVKIVKEGDVYRELHRLLKDSALRKRVGEESFSLWKGKRGVAERVLKFVGEKVEL